MTGVEEEVESARSVLVEVFFKKGQTLRDCLRIGSIFVRGKMRNPIS
jgi:hypothetical protein